MTMSVRDSKVKLMPIGDNQPLDFAQNTRERLNQSFVHFPY